MSADEQLLANLVEWQMPVAVCVFVFMFSLGFITVNSLNK